MMNTITIQVYKYEELSKEIQEKVLDKYRHKEVESHWWWQNTYFDFVEICSKLEIDINPSEIFFSGFYSQGNGSSFASYIFNIFKFMDAVHTKKWKEYAPNLDFDFCPCSIDRRVMALMEKGDININFKTFNKHRYYYLHSDFEFEYYNNNRTEYPRIEDELENLRKWIVGIFIDLNQYLYNQLQKEYEWLISDEYIIQMFEEENYQFTNKGYPTDKITN